MMDKQQLIQLLEFSKNEILPFRGDLEKVRRRIARINTRLNEWKTKDGSQAVLDSIKKFGYEYGLEASNIVSPLDDINRYFAIKDRITEYNRLTTHYWNSKYEEETLSELYQGSLITWLVCSLRLDYGVLEDRSNIRGNEVLVEHEIRSYVQERKDGLFLVSPIKQSNNGLARDLETKIFSILSQGNVIYGKISLYSSAQLIEYTSDLGLVFNDFLMFYLMADSDYSRLADSLKAKLEELQPDNFSARKLRHKVVSIEEFDKTWFDKWESLYSLINARKRFNSFIFQR